MKNNRKNKSWLRNKNQIKNPKIFTCTMIRNKKGEFCVLGGLTKVLNRKNQHSEDWVGVDTRDFTCELRNSRIISR